MSAHQLTVLPEKRILSAPDGAFVADVLLDSHIPIGFLCRQRGLCGKCLVEIVEGQAEPPDAAERAVLGRQNRGPGFRLACRLKVRAPLSIRILPEARLSTTTPLMEGRRREIAVDPPLKKFVLDAPEASSSDPESALDGLLAKFAFPRPSASAGVLPVLAGLDPRRAQTVTAVLYDNRRILAVEPGDASGRAFGAAVDLGTTTVVVEIVDLNDGRTAGVSAGLNGQIRFGADVVSRITAAHGDPDKRFGLRDEARRTINGLLAEAGRQAGIRSQDLYEVVVAGNTAMSHLFLGLPVTTLAAAPFRALFSTLEPLDAPAGGLDMNGAGRVYMAPNIKSFVGGDIAAGLAAVDIESGPERSLFLDLGTNGEIVVKKGSR
ncbi:MAG: 2Fe-2S iron-sulfur cluster-binding protein, partial [Candidatus Aminicenantales bacterium]